jgi:Peptidase A4 family
VHTNVPPPLDVLPSNAADFPQKPSAAHRGEGGLLRLVIALVVIGGLLAVVHVEVGLDQVARWVVNIASTVHLPESAVPESRNWAGYTATGGTFTEVSGTWSVPQFAADSPAGADAIWVGIGGVHGTDLIQAGTQETVTGRGTTQYQAWVETLPQASRPVPLSISAADSVTVSLQEQSSGNWLVSFMNNTTGKSYQVPITYASSRSSAEWIVEAPSARRGRVLPLDNFGSVGFTQSTTVRDGQTLTVAGAGGHPVTMVGQRSRPLARPSSLDEDGATFSVLQSLR